MTINEEIKENKYYPATLEYGIRCANRDMRLLKKAIVIDIIFPLNKFLASKGLRK